MWGIGDPRFTPDKTLEQNKDQEHAEAKAAAPDTAAKLQAAVAQSPVDVALLHDPGIAADMGDDVPLVLAGHYHRFSQDQLGKSTIMQVEGSTGGAGLRAVDESSTAVPLEASVLYFDRTTHRLVAYDHIVVSGVGGSSASIERHVVPTSTSSTTTSLSTSTTATP
jgi:hypothetical protein